VLGSGRRTQAELLLMGSDSTRDHQMALKPPRSVTLERGGRGGDKRADKRFPVVTVQPALRLVYVVVYVVVVQHVQHERLKVFPPASVSDVILIPSSHRKL